MNSFFKCSLLLLLFAIVQCKKKNANCSDGIANQGEKYTDCGGPCQACPTCYDSIQNQGETGIDCGGGVCVPCGSSGTSKGNVSYPDSGFYGKNLLRKVLLDTIYPGENVSLHAVIEAEAKVLVRLTDLWVPSSYVSWSFGQGNTNWTQSFILQGESEQEFYGAGPLEADMMIFAAPATSSNLEPFRIDYFENGSTIAVFSKTVTILK
jgi:hypothetical protein